MSDEFKPFIGKKLASVFKMGHGVQFEFEDRSVLFVGPEEPKLKFLLLPAKPARKKRSKKKS